MHFSHKSGSATWIKQYHNILSYIESKDKLPLNLIVWPAVYHDLPLSLINELSSFLSTMLPRGRLRKQNLATSNIHEEKKSAVRGKHK